MPNLTQPLALIAAAFVAFLTAALLGKKVIPLLHKLKFGQTILDIGPSWHKNKQGTPTMGGVLFIAGMLLAVIVMLVFCGTVLNWNILGYCLCLRHYRYYYGCGGASHRFECGLFFV